MQPGKATTPRHASRTMRCQKANRKPRDGGFPTGKRRLATNTMALLLGEEAKKCSGAATYPVLRRLVARLEVKADYKGRVPLETAAYRVIVERALVHACNKPDE